MLVTRNHMPKGISYKGNLHEVYFKFIYDLTYSKDKVMVYERNIFKEFLRVISDAKDFILIDVFLFNSYKNKGDFPNYTEDLTAALINKKKENKDIRIVLITDEINIFYGAYQPKHFQDLKANNIEVIITDFDMIPDSNILYSFLWRLLRINKLGVEGRGWITNILSKDPEKLTLRTYLRMFNFKANHRKVLITENEGLVTSFNPHDTSGNHSNIGFLVKGKILEDLVQSENAILQYSNIKPIDYISPITYKNNIRAMVITEGKIWTELLEEIKASRKGDSIKITLFYLAENKLINELIAASKRGVKIHMILDYNRDAFGLKKVGIPNRPVAHKLSQLSDIRIKWYKTHGEQFHNKMIIFERDEKVIIIGGSCNFTRRNLKDYNLESNLKVVLPAHNIEAKKILDYFNRIWDNEAGEYTIDYKAEKRILLRTIGYYIQEWTGLGSF